VKADLRSDAVTRDLRALLGDDAVASGSIRRYLTDETETRGVHGRADAVCLPADVDQVAEIVSWSYERGVPIVPRGGGTGYTGGAVPTEGGVVVSLERMSRVRSFDPLLWRIHVEAGVRTGDLRRIVRESGLYFPPDPGAAEQSQIGGNIATNAGGPHAFKYGVTGSWVTGLEAVLLLFRDGEYPWKNACVSISMAVGHFITQAAAHGLIFGMIAAFVYEIRLTTISVSFDHWFNLIILFVLVDLGFYVEHCCSHRIRFLWASHSVHHSSEKMLATTTYRLSWTPILSGVFAFYLPIVWIGYDPVWVYGMVSVSLTYQFFVHTELVPRIAWIEW